MKVCAVLVLLAACSHVRPAGPSAEVEVLGLSMQRQGALATPAAQNRALQRAAWIAHPDTLRFSLQHAATGVTFKLFQPEGALTGLVAQSERLQPFGAKAVVVVHRSADEVAKLAQLASVHAEGDAQEADLSIAQMHADKNAFELAVLAAAKTAHDDAAALYGTITVINYQAAVGENDVRVSADVAVRFGAAPQGAADGEVE